MSNSVVFFVGVLGWVVATLVIGVWCSTRAKRSLEDYLLAGRGLPWHIIGFSLLGTYIGGGTLFGLAGKIYMEGIIYVLVPVGVFVAFVLLGRASQTYRAVGNRQVRYLERNRPVSLADRFAREYGEFVRVPVALVICAIMVSFMAIQIRVGGLLIITYFRLDYLLACLLTGLLQTCRT